MSNVCVHLAVCLLDYFMDNHDLKFDTILLVSFACLTLAGKYNFYNLCKYLHNFIYFFKIHYFNSENRRTLFKYTKTEYYASSIE